MSELQPGAAEATVVTRPVGIFGTKIPSSVAYGIGLLLFFMPFIDIKCNNMILQNVSGVQLATGFEIEAPGSANSLLDGLDKMNSDDEVKMKTETGDPNLLAMVSLVLGIGAFILVLINGRKYITGAVIAGILCAAALIATMIDIKRKVKLDLPDKTRSAAGLEKFGEGMHIAVDFTPWFYITVIAFGLGAWFCYKRMQVK